MNVLMICSEKLPVPAIRGGAIQTYIGGVAKMLSRHHQITILGRSDPDLPREATVDGIHYVRFDTDGIFELYHKDVVQYIRQHSNQFDIIHIFNRPRLVGDIRDAAPAARIILSMHNDMFQPRKISKYEGARAVANCKKIITISNYIGQTVCNYFPEAASKVRTIYSGVDLDRFVPMSRSEQARQMKSRLKAKHNIQSKKIILFVGRLTPKKGIHMLLRAMTQLKSSDAALVIVGGTWYSDNRVTDYVAYVRSLSARSPVPVYTTGYVPAENIHHWFWAGDIFVCPSLWEEPLARVHYEAMAAGLPILTTARGGNPEIINNNGLIVEHPENAGEFTEKIRMMLSDSKLCQKMGDKGRLMAEQNFSWDRVANDILDVWGTA